MNKTEILAPAGSEEALKAAVLSGADAVYLGVGSFNARKNAKNFTEDTLNEAVQYCHSRGVKVHITLNTLIKDSEIPSAVETIKMICNSGADALIIQDLGIVSLVREICPDIEMHASTQLSTGTLEGLHKLKDMGFCRAVLPRELSFDEIKYLCENSPLELELFVHGALCMCVSGQCLMSAFLGSRSGNRGLCAQPCRLPFKVENGTGHDLSLKDLSLIKHIRELSDLGIVSFKIEGRMKRPEYVYAAVKACKMAENGELNAEITNDLESLFTRSGFTDGYYEKHLGRDMFGFREKENVQSATKELLNKYASMYNKETPRFTVNFEFHGAIGENAVLKATCNGYEAICESENPCEEPINRPISQERIVDALKKCGGTQFFAGEITTDENIDYTLPISALNAMRRSVLSELELKITGNKERILSPAPTSDYITASDKRDIYCRFDSAEQVPDNAKSCTVFVPLTTNNELIKQNSWGVELPHGMFGNSEKVAEILQKSSAEYVLCHTLDAVALAQKCDKKVIVSPSMNIINSYSMDEAKRLGIDEAIVSAECSLEHFKNISSPIRKGILVYGRNVMMLTRNCPIKNGKTCAECGRNSSITDRLDISFPVRCSFGYSEIYNSRPIYMADRLREIPPADILFFNFTVETKAEAEKVLNAYKKEEKPEGEYTRGLLYRGVE